jgi:aryl-alcohol dehydrogenase-like predicted oxidoreductase
MLLSSTGVVFNLPEIALGCMSLPERFSEAERIVHQAIDAGITFFDTADLYQKGKNEENLGKSIQSRRSELILATKVGNEWNSDGTAWHWNPRKEHILKAVEDSLKRLRTDYLDLYQLHGGTLDDPWHEVFEACSTVPWIVDQRRRFFRSLWLRRHAFWCEAPLQKDS